jgi:hypothetical protein
MHIGYGIFFFRSGGERCGRFFVFRCGSGEYDLFAFQFGGETCSFFVANLIFRSNRASLRTISRPLKFERFDFVYLVLTVHNLGPMV